MRTGKNPFPCSAATTSRIGNHTRVKHILLNSDTLPYIRQNMASSPKGSSSIGFCLCRYSDGPNNLRLSSPPPTLDRTYAIQKVLSQAMSSTKRSNEVVTHVDLFLTLSTSFANLQIPSKSNERPVVVVDGYAVAKSWLWSAEELNNI